MDVVSSVGAVAALVFNLVTAIKACKELSDRFQDAANTIQKLTTELETLYGALEQLVNLMNHDAYALKLRWDTNRSLPGIFNKATISFDATIKSLQHDLGNASLNQALGKKARMKYIWNESTMQDHLTQLRAQSNALQLLLTVLQTGSMSEMKIHLIGLESALKTFSAPNMQPPVPFDGLAEYPSILDEPEDLLDLDWSEDNRVLQPSGYSYKSVHTDRLAKAFAIDDIKEEEVRPHLIGSPIGEESPESDNASGSSLETQISNSNTSFSTPTSVQQDNYFVSKTIIDGEIVPEMPFLTTETSSDSPLQALLSSNVPLDHLDNKPVSSTTESPLTLPNEVPALSTKDFNASNTPELQSPIHSDSARLLGTNKDEPRPIASLLEHLDRETLHQLLQRPIHYAIEQNDVNLLEALSAEGLDVNQIDTLTNKTPLALAINLNNKQATFHLLAQGADFSPKLESNKGVSLLTAAGRKFSVKALDYACLPKCHELSTPTGRVLLRVAQKSDRWDIVQDLINGAASTTNIGQILDAEDTLHWAVQLTDPATTDFIIRSGASITTKVITNPGFWVLPIHLAAQRTDFGHVGVLITHGASILDAASEGRLPYYFAVARSNHAMIKLHFNEMTKALKSRTSSKKYPSALEKEMLAGVSSACRRGDASVLKLALDLSEQQLGKRTWNSLLLFISVQLARKDVTIFLLDYGSNPSFRFKGKLAEDATFVALKGDYHHPDNDISDYEPCKALVRAARARYEAAAEPMGASAEDNGERVQDPLRQVTRESFTESTNSSKTSLRKYFRAKSLALR